MDLAWHWSCPPSCSTERDGGLTHCASTHGLKYTEGECGNRKEGRKTISGMTCPSFKRPWHGSSIAGYIVSIHNNTGQLFPEDKFSDGWVDQCSRNFSSVPEFSETVSLEGLK